MNNNKKALGIMIGTLVFLLVLAVVLLSVIIISLTKNDDPVITTIPPLQSQSSGPVQSGGEPLPSDSAGSSGSQTSKIPQTTDTPEQTPALTTGTQTVPDTGSTTSGTEEDPVTTPTPTVSSKPAVDGPNVPVGEIIEVVNPDGSIVRSGAFRDNGPTSLHMVIEWEARYASRNASTASLTVRVYLQCYSIGVAARNNGTLTIGGESSTFQTPGIFYSTNDLHYTLMTAKTQTISRSAGSVTEVDLSAAWNFMGSYSGVTIEWLTVAGTIEI